MKLLLDSHVVIWSVDNPARLTSLASRALRNPAHELVISAATVWEIAIKFGIGKIELSLPYRGWMEQAIQSLGANVLPVLIAHADVQSQLPFHHRDPFDRMIIAQAMVEEVPIVSCDSHFDQYDIERLW